jgi:serine/threonine protein phosphatase PrpC
MTLALRYAIRTDVGLLREGNEDSAFAGPRLLAIADGMGGHAAGEVASAVAISTITTLADNVPGNDLLDALSRAVATANRRLHDMSAEDPSVEGMGTTLTAMLWSGPKFGLCHIGDSRAYLLRGDELRQITRDHTLVQALVDDGRISRHEAASHPQRSLLLRALDGSPDAEPDLVVLAAQVGDRYLLCSDGLSDVVSDQDVQRTLATLPDPDEAVLRLIDLALRGGGPDNITCIVADVIDSTATTLIPSEKPVLVGAAVASPNGSATTKPRPVSAAARPQVVPHTAPQAAVPTQTAVAGSTLTEQEQDDEEEEQQGAARRRWPIVTSLVVVLVVVVAGAAYAGWRYTQQQYYVGATGGRVAIFRGVDQQVAGLSLSSVYQKTAIPLAMVPSNDLAQIRATITSTGLPDARRIIGNIKRDYQQCQQASLARAAYQARLARYHAALATYRKQFGTTKPIRVHGVAHVPPRAPGAPPPFPPLCPAGTAGGTAASSGSGGTP